jgi:hypothetical protein
MVFIVGFHRLEVRILVSRTAHDDRSSFRNEIKGLPETRRELPVLPGAVRKCKIQDAAFLVRRLLLENTRCPLSHFEQLGAVLQVVLIRSLVSAYLP